MKTKAAVICFVIIAILIVLAGLIIYYIKYDKSFEQNIKFKGLVLEKISLDNQEKDSAYLNIDLCNVWFNKDRWCAVSENDYLSNSSLTWEKVNYNKCCLKANSDSKFIYVKDDKNNVTKYNISDYINEVIYFDVQIEDTLIVVKDKTKLSINLSTIGNPNKDVSVISSNEKVAKYVNGFVVGIGNGKVDIAVKDNYGHEKIFKVTVTSLITKPKINNNKKFLSSNTYTSKENKLLDEFLDYRVKKAGEKTRAGVVAAARFLALEFKHKVPYFLENGRLFDNGYSDYIDGEGRY